MRSGLLGSGTSDATTTVISVGLPLATIKGLMSWNNPFS
jgi:hypothetical protein